VYWWTGARLAKVSGVRQVTLQPTQPQGLERTSKAQEAVCAEVEIGVDHKIDIVAGAPGEKRS